MSALDNLNKGNGVLPASPITNGKEIPVKDFMLENGVDIRDIRSSKGKVKTSEDAQMVAVMECLKLPKEEVEAFGNSNKIDHEIVYSPKLEKEFGDIKLYKARLLSLYKPRYNGNKPALIGVSHVYMLVDANNNIRARNICDFKETLTHGSETREYHIFSTLSAPTPLKEKLDYYSDLRSNEPFAFGLNLETGKAIDREKMREYRDIVFDGAAIVDKITKNIKAREALEEKKKNLDARRKEFETGKAKATPVSDFIK